MRANWTEISRPALGANLQAFRRRLRRGALASGPPPRLCAVVKANAYGHGLIECARTLVAAGAEWLAVTDTAEAVALRQARIRGRILVLGDFDGADAHAMARLGLTPTVWTEAQVLRLARAASPHAGVAVHLKVDTGMARLGAPAAALPRLARQAARRELKVEAIYTHLASSEGPAAGVAVQLRRLAAALAAVDPAITTAPGFFWHAANSAAAWRWAALRGGLASPPGSMLPGPGLARIGLGLYGSCLAAEAEPHLRPVLAWKTRVIALRRIPAGAPVGYGGDRPGGWKARRPAWIATLACGYADGYFRAIHAVRAAHVLIRGRRAPFAGRISMDLMSVDVTGIPGVRRGDEAVLIGRQGRERIRPADLARWAGTIPYEVTCAIAARVPRHYR